MTDPSSASDKDLLERLNALKPTTVSLDASENSLGVSVPATAVVSSEPTSREDALSARLRSLRHGGAGSPSASPSREGTPASPGPRTPAQSTAEIDIPVAKNAPASTPSKSQSFSIPGQVGEEQDPLYLDDEQVLHDFLDGLSGDDDFDPTSIPPPPATQPESEEGRVAALLESLGKEARAHGKEGRDEDDDDSEGEEMAREIARVMAQAGDEAELARTSGKDDQDAPPDTTPAGRPPELPSSSTFSGDGPDSHSASSPPSVTASVPAPVSASATASNPSTDAQTSKPDTNTDNTSTDAPQFTLPSVPSQLPDSPSTATTTTTAHNHHRSPSSSSSHSSFEASITARMAALSGLGPSSSSSSDPTDPFASLLPSAPTFAPDTRARSTAYRGRTAGRQAYTDEDQQTWCVVCLDDATVRCAGCDGDVYCARCFRDMHVGPAAGFDERGHRWTKFERPGR